jgi:hypothetical protein
MPLSNTPVLSGNKVATQNRVMPDLTWMSKGELRKLIENLYWEKNRDKEEINSLKEQQRLILKEITFYQKRYLELLDNNSDKKELDLSYLKVAI